MTTNNGLLLIDKPRGLTSHDVVARVRRLLDERKVGHAGTLDPMATGLLVMAVGPSTRLLRFAQAQVKRYSGTVLLGVATDSLDADGTVLERRPVPALSHAEMTSAVASMIGPQLQTPPMVSALKVGGQRLHQLARRGVEVERAPRPITVSEFRVSPTDDPARWNFEVECSVGTYVRVLLSDVAQRLDTLGHLSELRRVSSGSYHVDRAVTLEALEELLARNQSPMRVPRTFVTHLETAVVNANDEQRMRRGQQLQLASAFESSEIAAVNERGDLVGILERRADRWQPALVVPVEERSEQR